MNISNAIGNTPIIQLNKVVPADVGAIYLKLEGNNPSGSMKDRMALAVIDAALASGVVSNDGRIVEYTGGSTGTSLATICAPRNLNLTIVTSDAFSLEKRTHMRALGAELIELPSENGRTTRDLIHRMIAKAKSLTKESNTYLVDQFNNPHASKGYANITVELLSQLPRVPDAFVQSVGTAQCIKGVGDEFQQRGIKIHRVAVEPAESPVLSGGQPGPHKIEGVGAGFLPPIWNDKIVDQIEAVSTEDAMLMTKRLAAEEGIFAGTSTGANVVASIRVAKQLGPDSMVATLACDSGLKYISTPLYA